MVTLVFHIDDGEDALYLWSNGVATTSDSFDKWIERLDGFWRVIDGKLWFSNHYDMSNPWLARDDVHEAFERHIASLVLGPSDTQKL